MYSTIYLQILGEEKCNSKENLVLGYKKGIDVPVYLTYYCKQNGIHIIDKPVLYSELLKNYQTREGIIKVLLDRTNELGRMAMSMKRKDVAKQLKQQRKLAK